MIKKIIFDVDNTLIQWKDEYYAKLNKPFEELQIRYTQQDVLNVVEAIKKYEKTYEYFKVENMQEIFCKTLNKKLPQDFTNIVLKYFKTCVPDKLPKEDIETLEYLYKKYELVILTNWFENVQIERLKKVDILKYFKKIYATENIKIKPNSESFKIAAGKFELKECIMIGDNIKTDIQGAIVCGMNAILIDPKSSKNEQKEYRTISYLSELKDIL